MTIARTGADIELVAYSGGRELARAAVADVHFLGAHAFDQPAAQLADPAAAREALSIVNGAPGQVGLAVECLATGRMATANADHAAVAASTLKAAILVTALSQDDADPTRPEMYPIYRAAIVASDNDAANRVLAQVGDGVTVNGTARVNGLMRRLGMRSSFLDGPYRLTGAPSRKRTSAADLEQLARALYLAASGGGPLAGVGVSMHEARVLIALMASADYPGLIQDNVAGPVAHKAGWLGSVQNDLAMAFGTLGGTCLIGLTTEGLSFTAADAIGRQLARRVLPLLAVPRTAPPPQSPSTTVNRAISSTTGARATTTSAVIPSRRSRRTSAPPWAWFGGAAALVGTLGAAAAHRHTVLRRRRLHRARERRANTAR